MSLVLLSGVTAVLVLRDIFNKLKITCADGIIISCVMLAAVLLFISASRGGDTPSVCIIEINGEEFARYDLMSIKNEKIIEIDNEYGRNTIVIDNRGAAVTFSDCADCLEVKAGRIDKSGQSLICLPHRLTVKLDGKNNSDGTSW